MNLCPCPTRPQVETLMRRCKSPLQGRFALENAHGTLASCYGALERLLIEVEMLRAETEKRKKRKP